MNRFSDSFQKLTDKLAGWLEQLILMLPNIMIAVAFLFFTYLGVRFSKKYISKTLNRYTTNPVMANILTHIIVSVVFLIAIYLALTVMQLDNALTTLLGGAGIAGLAVGLALQDPIINLFSGVMMSVKDYYHIGDVIESNDYFGTIQKISTRNTIIRTPSGQEVLIPNKDILQKPLINYSHNGERRISIFCGVSYADDLDKAKRIAIEAIKSSIDLMPDKPLKFYYKEFAESSINFEIQYWKQITAQADYNQAVHEGIVAIKKAFANNEISIPFPIRTLDFGISGGANLSEMLVNNKENGIEAQG